MTEIAEKKPEALEWLMKELPTFGNYTYDSLTKNFRVRDEFITKYGFAIPSRKAINEIAAYSPLIEVGAGSGYWAYELKLAGADVIATDPATGHYTVQGLHLNGNNGRWNYLYTDVEKIDGVAAVKKYPGRNLLTVWPDYKDRWPAEVLAAFTGEYVIYVGEDEWGCTGSPLFHRYLKMRFVEQKTIGIPNFDGIHDFVRIWRRK